MKKYQKSCWLLLIFSIWFCWPTQVYADGMEGLAGVGEFLFALFFAFCTIAIVNLLLAIYNIKEKKKGIRIFNMIFLAPIVFVGLVFFDEPFSDIYFYLVWTWIIVQIWIIYKSYP